MKYFISAEELHKMVIESVLHFCEHMEYDVTDIIKNHEKRPLEQTINMVLFRAMLKEKK